VYASDVLVVGGGAAGLVAAVVAARAGAAVTLLERGERVGKKILATGNGRCNLSNTAIEGTSGSAYYNNPGFVAPTLERYGCEATRAFFEELGLLTIADERGWVFPRTRSANSVLDVLWGQVQRLGVEVHTGCAARRLSTGARDVRGGHDVHDVRDENGENDKNGGRGRLLVETGERDFVARAVVLACGVTPELEALACQQTLEPTPILGPLKTTTEPLKGLDGVRVNCRVRLLDEHTCVEEETGEVLFRSYGVSGIAIFNLSRFASPGQELSLDLFPEFTEAELTTLLAERLRMLAGSLRSSVELSAADFFGGMLPARLVSVVLRATGLRPAATLEPAALPRLAHALKDYRLVVRGGPTEAQAQVTRGGLDPQRFDPAALESRTCPGLFAAGECLNIDGPCGGFNLHWAWSSALIASTAAVCRAARS
jgi:predicted Rossmann fold flavoprotein